MRTTRPWTLTPEAKQTIRELRSRGVHPDAIAAREYPRVGGDCRPINARTIYAVTGRETEAEFEMRMLGGAE